MKNPLKLFERTIRQMDEENDLGNASETGRKKLEVLLRKYLNRYLHSNFAQKQHKFLKTLRKAYTTYGKSTFRKNNANLKGWRANALKPAFRKELRERINISLDMIKTQDKQRMAILQTRFLSWLAGKQANTTKPQSLTKAMQVDKLIRKNDKHYNMILADQTRKMISNFDNIVAEHYKAIGFFWKTRRDNRVTGKPGGKNPKGNEMHGDHYDREDKFFFYKDNWATKQGLIDKSNKAFAWAEFEDGLPGQPINCRCYAYNIYELEDIPNTLLSEKGKRYLENLQKK